MLQVELFSLDNSTHMGILLGFLVPLQLIDMVKITCDESTIQRLSILSDAFNGLRASSSHNWFFRMLLGIGGLKFFELGLTDVVLNSLDVSIKSRLNHIKLLLHIRFWPVLPSESEQGLFIFLDFLQLHT